MRILFTKNERFLSRLIRWRSGSPASHVALEFAPNLILQSEWNSGVALLTKDQLLKDNQLVASFRVPPVDIQPILKNVGKDYDRLAFLSLALFPESPRNKPDSFICTEMVSLVLWRTELVLTPGQLLELMRHYSAAEINGIEEEKEENE